MTAHGSLPPALSIFLCLAAGFTVCGAWFGLCALFSALLKKRPTLMFFAPLPAALPFAAAVLFLTGPIPAAPLSTENVICAGAAALAAAALSAWIVRQDASRVRLCGSALLRWCAGGAIMELPQRFVMQSLLFALLRLLAVPRPEVWAVLCTAAVWCLGIAAQTVLAKARFDRTFRLEIAVSALFSLGAGFAYQTTGQFIFPVAAHMLERFFSNAMAERREP